MIKGIFSCIDAHTCGNPVRVVTSCAPDLQGSTMSEKRQDFLQNHDWIRKGLMFEPRGHDIMSGSIIYPPINEDADASILFIETSGCLPMCGHGTIGTVTVAIESGLIIPKTPGFLILDVPAGKLRVEYQQKNGKVISVKIFNVPCYLAYKDVEVICPDLGRLKIDIAYGGNYYAIVDPQKNYSGLEDFSPNDILKYSPIIRDLLNQCVQPVHPEDPSVNGVSHLLWTGKPQHPESTAANAVFYGEKAIDRSPCGTGTSARMAQWHAKGLLKKGQKFVHESIIGSQFIGHIEQETTVGDFPAIIPSIQGWAKTFGHNTITIDDDDPFAYGFTV
ncbi:MAG: 4-hydroxyproline epimerase [Alcanivoracaceae bacterium]|nr:4-hydroxyproline epimerase [Alcanivoracaceae bacterium]